MNEGFLEREARQAHKKNRKLFSILLLVYVVIVAVIVFVVKDTVDFSDYRIRKLAVGLAVFSVLMLVFTVIGLLSTVQGVTDGKSLILPFQENSNKAVAEIIDREVQEGKVLVDEYLENFSDREKAHGERIMLTPSYLLLFNSMGKIMAIPREKIYWICAQAGIKGRGSYIVRMLIFTEKKTFDHMEGTDVRHLEEIADKLYQYIPNVFRDYDPFELSYKLYKLFDKDRGEFLKFYESEKRKHGDI